MPTEKKVIVGRAKINLSAADARRTSRKNSIKIFISEIRAQRRLNFLFYLWPGA
jgi:hypothetical protein